MVKKNENKKYKYTYLGSAAPKVGGFGLGLGLGWAVGSRCVLSCSSLFFTFFVFSFFLENGMDK